MHPVKSVGRGVIRMGLPSLVVRDRHDRSFGVMMSGREILDQRSHRESRPAVEIQVPEKDGHPRVLPSKHRNHVREWLYQGLFEVTRILIVGAEMDEGDVWRRKSW